MASISSNTLAAADVQVIVARIMKWQQEHQQVFAMSDGLDATTKSGVSSQPKFSLACTVQPKSQMLADGPELTLECKARACGKAFNFTLTAAQADKFIRVSASPLYPLVA